jgi:hypothetical protein
MISYESEALISTKDTHLFALDAFVAVLDTHRMQNDPSYLLTRHATLSLQPRESYLGPVPCFFLRLTFWMFLLQDFDRSLDSEVESRHRVVTLCLRFVDCGSLDMKRVKVGE